MRYDYTYKTSFFSYAGGGASSQGEVEVLDELGGVGVLLHDVGQELAVVPGGGHGGALVYVDFEDEGIVAEVVA